MALEQVRGTQNFSLPFDRIFSSHGSYQIMDCILSNYKLEQKLGDLMKFTKLEESVVESGLRTLISEELIIKNHDSYTANFSSERMDSLFSYYRATLNANFHSLEFQKNKLQ